MKKSLLVYIFCLIGISCLHAQLGMHDWQLHYAYNDVTLIEQSTNKIYALSNGALFSVDKSDGDITYYNKLTGLNSAEIAQIKYDKNHKRLIILYKDGNIDLLYDNNTLYNIPDLYNTQQNINKSANCITIAGNYAYIGMDFGILVLNLERREIADTYYIGANATEISVRNICISGDSIYAASSDSVYTAYLKNNLVDYAFWHTRKDIPGRSTIQNILSFQHQLCLLRDSALYCYNGEQWAQHIPDTKIYKIIEEDNGDRLYGLVSNGTYNIQPDFSYQHIGVFYGSEDVTYDTYEQTYWFASHYQGVGKFDTRVSMYDSYVPNSPENNTAYRIRISDNKVFVVPGGYMSLANNIPGMVMTYENGQWRNYTQAYMQEKTGTYTADYCDVAAMPNDPSHFFVASFGSGLMEFRNNEFYMRHNQTNSPLISVTSAPERYTWVDGLAMDKEGNLWMYNRAKDGLKVLLHTGEWVTLSNVATNDIHRMKNLIISNHNPNLKLLFSTLTSQSHTPQGIGAMDDNGTIAYQADDKAAFHRNFTDQNNNRLTPTYILSAAQDNNGALWVGTNAGIMVFDNPETLLTSNACRRIIIPRNDGTNLADYLLNDEQINALAIDGGNRKWIGTETSGLYLMSENGEETLEHFTTENSPLPSNNIMSIAINPNNGEIFIGTGGGLVSYQNDAAVAKDDFSHVYAYPNPVRENFTDVITIAGLMENSIVKFTDNAGNLLCETRSNGGIAIWDGKDAYGRRVRSGVYFALCNSENGEQYALTKILIIN